MNRRKESNKQLSSEVVTAEPPHRQQGAPLPAPDGAGSTRRPRDGLTVFLLFSLMANKLMHMLMERKGGERKGGERR